MNRMIAAWHLMLLLSTPAWPHSASDAYLTLSLSPGVPGQTTLHGQWDIALRDLDFVLKLDDDGDGQITWGEVKRRQQAIERYAASGLHFVDPAGGSDCTVKPQRFAIDRHADGAYAALFFDIICAGAPQALTLNYSLFFAIDPSHRGIFVFHSGDATSTALLSPQNAHIRLPLER